MHKAMALLFRVRGIADLHVFVDAVALHAFVRRSPPPPYDVAVGRASDTATCSYVPPIGRGVPPPACIPPANFVRPGRAWFDDSTTSSSDSEALWYANVNHACIFSSFLSN